MLATGADAVPRCFGVVRVERGWIVLSPRQIKLALRARRWWVVRVEVEVASELLTAPMVKDHHLQQVQVLYGGENPEEEPSCPSPSME